MIGIDTNILIRFLVRDDDTQHAMAVKFFGGLKPHKPGFVSGVVMVELIWTLKRLYGYGNDQITKAVVSLCTTKEIQVEYGIEILSILPKTQKVEMIADHLVAWSGTRAGCTHTVTFDKRAAKHTPGMELLA